MLTFLLLDDRNMEGFYSLKNSFSNFDVINTFNF